MAPTNDRWKRLRDQIPVTNQWAYFDNAAVAPLPLPARDAILQWAGEAADQGDTVWPTWAARAEQTRQAAAAMIGASPGEIALVPNTTSGISLVAEGFPWKAGDNVVTLANEFPSNLYPWMNLADRGVETRRVPVEGVAVDLDRVAEACDERTRIISVSWVGYSTGWRLDLDQLVEMAHQRGILVFLDAIQALGVFPLNVRRTPIDFAAADGHKWMLGPEGAGLLYVRQDRLADLRPLCVGWNSVKHRQDFDHIELDVRDEAARYEGGSQNMVGMIALGASLELLTEWGVSPDASPIAQRVLEITQYACERLQQIGAHVVSSRDEPHRSGIVSFDLPGRDLAAERRRCLEARVVLSYRSGYLRISPHAYANEEDVERLIKTLQR